MLFWIVAGTLSAVVALLLARPLLAPPPPGGEGTPDTVIYRGQLAEVERDLARGLLNPAEAERARTEIARRLLAADRAGPARVTEAPRRIALVAATLAAALTVLGSLLLYAELGAPGARDEPRAARLAEAERLRSVRPSQAEAEAQAAEFLPPPPADLPEDYLQMIARLREVVPTRANDLEGWELLALHEARLGNYGASARAQERVVALKGDDATADDYLGLVDRMVAAAGGLVTPEAEAVLSQVFERDPQNVGLLYYLGLVEAQTGRPDRAFPLWRRVVEQAPPDSFHYRLAASQIEDMAWLAGVDYTLPAPAASGPTQEEIAAAEAMPLQHRQQMIGAMVDSLSQRLATQGGPPEDWARLVTSLGVLGDSEQAAAILAEARTTFAASPEAQRLFDDAARSAGLSE